MSQDLYHVLILEDDPIQASLLKMTLEKYPQISISAYNSIKQVEEHNQRTYDLILCDYYLNHVDGETTLQSLENILSPLPPLLWVTASRSISDTLKNKSIGVIQKPYLPSEVGKKVLQTLLEITENV